ncbi:hypothetical protein [Herpetosiphon giganteus]|uniref:hypothetical protein n=1 Tax=Herpetosiphon giganteus TaxID=2029754 RepID=UPI00195CD11B|nr:hypothetical protein [Herpetosiphon giganteus]MBM7842069.1 hypothetical protein [Herpetosiphon giganteus]
MKQFIKAFIFLLFFTGCSSHAKTNPQSPPIPAYPNSQLETLVIKASTPVGDGQTFQFKSTDPIEKILDWYKQTLIQEGWEMSSMPMNINQIQFSDPSGCPRYYVTITGTENEQTTTIELLLYAPGCE